MFQVLLHLLILELTTNKMLEPEDRVLRVHDRLTLRRQADKTLTVFGESNDGRGRPVPFLVLNHPGSLALHDGDTGACRPQVDTNDRPA